MSFRGRGGRSRGGRGRGRGRGIGPREARVAVDGQGRTMARIGAETTGYECNFVSEPDDSLKCLICLAAARDPWQHGKCGRLFCEKCLNKHGKEKPCPNCRTEQPLYFEDTRSKREIKALLVKCDNVERGCEWEGTVGTLEEHVDTCDFTVVNCPKQCNKNVMRKDLKQHLEDKCPNRDYECQHCRKKDSYANITEIHYDECTMIVLPCPNSECTQTLERAQIQMHLENDCEHTVILCKYEGIGCYVKMKRKDMGAHEQDDKAHLHQALNSVVRLQDNLLSATENIESMKKDMESATETIASMKKESSAMAVKLESATETIASMKKENSAMVVMLESAKKTITSTAIKLNETVETTRVLQEKSKMTKGVIFKFRVTKYEKRKNLNEVFYTHPFYSNSNGYHMRIQVYPNGYDEDEGTHVSVYFQLVQGKYDQQLSWPFVGNVTFELLNQLADEKHHHETVSLESEDDARIGGPDWGCSQSIPHHKLPYNPIRNTQYLKDDTLYFRVSVEVEGHKPWLECTAMRN